MRNPQQALQYQIIVTRPPNQAEFLLSQLSALDLDSIKVTHLPLIEIVPIASCLPKGDFDKAIFISANAASFFNHWERLDNSTLFGVGKATAAAIQSQTQCPVAYPEEMNAEGLLALPQLQRVSKDKIIIVKGEDGRPLLQQALAERGAQVTTLDVYQRKIPNWESQKNIAHQSSPQNVWVVTSAQAIDHLYRIQGLSEHPNHATKLIVSSDRLVELASQKGFTIFGQSSGASDLQLVQCVKSLFKLQD